MNRFKTTVAATVLTALMGVGVMVPFTAQASENGRRNTTYGVGALTGALLYKHKWLPAAVTGVGTYAAYHNWQAQINARHRRQNRLAQVHAYRSGFYSGHRVARLHRVTTTHRYRAVAHKHHRRR